MTGRTDIDEHPGVKAASIAEHRLMEDYEKRGKQNAALTKKVANLKKERERLKRKIEELKGLQL